MPVVRGTGITWTSETSLEGWKLIKNPGCKIKINLPKLPLRDGNAGRAGAIESGSLLPKLPLRDGNDSFEFSISEYPAFRNFL